MAMLSKYGKTEHLRIVRKCALRGTCTMFEPLCTKYLEDLNIFMKK